MVHTDIVREIRLVSDPDRLTARPSTGDVALALLVAAAQIAAAGIVDGSWHHVDPPRLWLAVGGALTLVFRRQRPVATVLVTVVLDTGLLTHSSSSWAPIATVVALYTLATCLDRVAAWVIGGLVGVWLAVASLLWQPADAALLHLVPFDYAIAAVAVGDAVRSRRAYLTQLEERAAQAEASREAEAARRVRDERIRIARDLHDDVAHHLTLVNAQAGVARYLLATDPETARLALGEIENNSRRALAEIRSTVSLLRDTLEIKTLEPRKSLTERQGLLDTFRAAGLHISYTETGIYTSSDHAVELAAYRILQEGLTNANKHGVGHEVKIDMTFTADLLQIRLSNPTEPNSRGRGTGMGLISLRERTHAVGGLLTTNFDNDSFTLNAELPRSPTGPQS